MTWLTDADPKAVADTNTQKTSSSDPYQDAKAQLKILEDKLDQTVQDLADGLINRAQFENLYRHYQNQRRVVRGFMQQAGDIAMLNRVGVGESMVIRERYAAKVLAYAVYDNLTSLPLHTVGQFPLESELVVGFFSGFRSAIAEIMGTGARKAVTDDGKGFNLTGSLERGKGLGLVSITERVRLAGGTISIVTDLNKGTCVSVRIPTTSRPHEYAQS